MFFVSLEIEGQQYSWSFCLAEFQEKDADEQVDENGRFSGEYYPFTLAGFIRKKGASSLLMLICL